MVVQERLYCTALIVKKLYGCENCYGCTGTGMVVRELVWFLLWLGTAMVVKTAMVARTATMYKNCCGYKNCYDCTRTGMVVKNL